METVHCFTMIITFLGILSATRFNAQSTAQPPTASVSAARSLDGLLQDYAYRAFDRHRPRTGRPYDGVVPSNISGIRITVMRLRSGSLRSKGVPSFNEFEIPIGVTEKPYVRRLALVYQNLGNWSSFYYKLPGYTFKAPVLGLLAYDATNLSATNLRELDVLASMKPISIRFGGVSLPSGVTTKCVWFNLSGLPQLNDSGPDNICTTYRQGHFSIVVNTTELPPAPGPSPGLPPSLSPVHVKKNKGKVWKIVGAVVGGLLALVLLVLLAIWINRYRQNKNLEKMIQHAESGEVLQKHRIGDAQLPMASMIRTRPKLENELAP
uniref:Coxsackievirus and adenovirus receptor n=1 Tax=Anthurium amnicola TaxID=1678845 RepID=A0A1D1YYZ2_9ARAE